MAQVTEAAGKTREVTAEALQALVERAEAALQAARDKVGTVACLTAQICVVTKLSGKVCICVGLGRHAMSSCRCKLCDLCCQTAGIAPGVRLQHLCSIELCIGSSRKCQHYKLGSQTAGIAPGVRLQEFCKAGLSMGFEPLESSLRYVCAQAASATGAARETAQEAVRRAEDNLQAAKDKAAQAYEATKGKAYETYEAGRDTAQQAAQAAVERAEAALQAARDKVGTSVAACLSWLQCLSCNHILQGFDIVVKQ